MSLSVFIGSIWGSVFVVLGILWYYSTTRGGSL